MIDRIKNNAFARNSLVLFVGTMTANVLAYVFHLVIGRMVSIPVYGEVESLTSLINIISIPAATLAMIATKYSACSKADGDPGESRELLNFLNLKVFKFGFPVFLVFIILTPWVNSFLRIESNLAIFLVWIMMFFSLFLSINGGILNGWQKFESSSWTGILGAIVKLAAGIILVKMGFQLSGVMGAFALGAVVSYFFSVYALNFVNQAKDTINKKFLEKINFSSIRGYVGPVFLGNLAVNILGNADMVVAKHNLSPEIAGQYGALTIVSKIIFFATGVIATVLFSMSAEDNHKNNNSMKIFKHAFFLMTALAVLATAFYFIFPKFVLFLLFGGKYADISGYLGWFAVNVTLFSLVNLILQYFLSIHETRIVYSLLVLSLGAVIAMMFVGQSISAILEIIALTQVLAVCAGVFFLFNKSNRGEKIYGKQ